MKISQEVSAPSMPDVIYLKSNITGRKQDGFQPRKGIPVESLTKEQAESYSELMKETFLKHWGFSQKKQSTRKIV